MFGKDKKEELIKLRAEHGVLKARVDELERKCVELEKTIDNISEHYSSLFDAFVNRDSDNPKSSAFFQPEHTFNMGGEE